MNCAISSMSGSWLPVLGNRQDAVGFDERRDHTCSTRKRCCDELVAHFTDAHAHELLVFERRRARAGQRGTHVLIVARAAAEQPLDNRLDDLLDHDDAAYWIARNAHNGTTRRATQDGGFARFHGDAVVKHLAHRGNRT